MTRSLRARLLAGLVLLLALGLLVSSAATYLALQNFLDQRVDTQLRADWPSALSSVGNPSGGRVPGDHEPQQQARPETYAALYSPDGKTLLYETGFSRVGSRPTSPPVLPAFVAHRAPPHPQLGT